MAGNNIYEKMRFKFYINSSNLLLQMQIFLINNIKIVYVNVVIRALLKTKRFLWNPYLANIIVKLILCVHKTKYLTKIPLPTFRRLIKHN